jgi:predicted peroxiredoxin
MTHHFELNALFNQVGGNYKLSELIAKEAAADDTTEEKIFYVLLQHQVELISEEFQELIDGHTEKSADLIRDGLGDVIVTVDGLFHRLELKYPDTSKWGQLHSDAIQAINAASQSLEAIRLLAMDHEGVDVKTAAVMLTQLGMGILLSMYQVAEKYGIDLHADQQAIVASNMSKFDTNEDVAIEGVAKYAQLNIKTEIVPSVIDGVTYYVIRCAEDTVDANGKKFFAGKILKSVNFREPTLVPLAVDAPLRTLFEPMRLAGDRSNTIYIAGPMGSGFAEAAFNAAAIELRQRGLKVYNPTDRGVVNGAEFEDYIRYDVRGLLQCESMYLLPGWKDPSVRIEVLLAKELGMSIFYHPDAERE